MGTAVKFYSSGMLVRLGFACAVHVDPEVVLIDEVLAVGDEAFQARCLDRIRTFQREGRTIVLVTHALDLVRQFCTQAVMLDHGVVHATGDPDEVVREMRMTILKQHLEFAHEEGSKEIEIAATRLLCVDGARSTGPLASGRPAGARDRPRRAHAPSRTPSCRSRCTTARTTSCSAPTRPRRASRSGPLAVPTHAALRDGPAAVHRREVLDHRRRPLARQPARLPRAGTALLVRGPAASRDGREQFYMPVKVEVAAP